VAEADAAGEPGDAELVAPVLGDAVAESCAPGDALAGADPEAEAPALGAPVAPLVPPDADGAADGDPLAAPVPPPAAAWSAPASDSVAPL
jgi:hypothetical protein